MTGSLPFGSDISTCPRYKRYRQWLQGDFAATLLAGEQPVLPTWFFPPGVSPLAASLIVSLLHTSPDVRISVQAARSHPWCTESADDTKGVYMSPSLSIIANNDAATNCTAANTRFDTVSETSSGPPSPIKNVEMTETPINLQENVFFDENNDILAGNIDIALESALNAAVATIEIDETDLLLLHETDTIPDYEQSQTRASPNSKSASTSQVLQSNIRGRNKEGRSSRQTTPSSRMALREQKEAVRREAKESDYNEKVASGSSSTFSKDNDQYEGQP